MVSKIVGRSTAHVSTCGMAASSRQHIWLSHLTNVGAQLCVLVFVKKRLEFAASNPLSARFVRAMDVGNDFGDLVGIKIQQHASPAGFANVVLARHVYGIHKVVVADAAFDQFWIIPRHDLLDDECHRWYVLRVHDRVAVRPHHGPAIPSERKPRYVQGVGQGHHQMIGGRGTASLLQSVRLQRDQQFVQGHLLVRHVVGKEKRTNFLLAKKMN